MLETKKTNLVRKIFGPEEMIKLWIVKEKKNNSKDVTSSQYQLAMDFN